MHSIEFELETITPMFMAGADGETFELRPPSLKGAMRFWWRAYYWGTQEGNKTSEEIEKEMAKREGEIFGIASDNGHKSSFSLRRKEGKLLRATKKFSGPHGFLLNYLSYGTEDKDNKEKKREYILNGSTFNVNLSMPNRDVNIEQAEIGHGSTPLTMTGHSERSRRVTDYESFSFAIDVVKSMYLLSVFGGLGAKSRNGFGNFVIKRILENSQENDQFFQKHIPDLFPDKSFFETLIVNQKLPRFSAFSKSMKVFKLKHTQKTPELCHSGLGEIYKACKGQMDESLSCSKRQYIASPITIQKKVRGELKSFGSSFLERRAKPYFLRVVKKSTTEYDGYIFYLPSTYCDGLERDRNNEPIPGNVDQKFKTCCEELNNYFLKTGKMEVIV